jgi:hypothetical protein
MRGTVSGPHPTRNPLSTFHRSHHRHHGFPRRQCPRMLRPRSRRQSSRRRAACRRRLLTRHCHECSVNLRRLAEIEGNAQTRVPTSACLRHHRALPPPHYHHHNTRPVPRGRPRAAHQPVHVLRPRHRPLRPPRRVPTGPHWGAPAEGAGVNHGGLQDLQVQPGHRRHLPYLPPRTMGEDPVGVRGLLPSLTSSQSWPRPSSLARNSLQHPTCPVGSLKPPLHADPMLPSRSTATSPCRPSTQTSCCPTRTPRVY